jgi:hypothetical protein
MVDGRLVNDSLRYQAVENGEGLGLRVGEKLCTYICAKVYTIVYGEFL